jgi:hypothetical protein
MRKAERSKKLRDLADLRDGIAYMQERVMLASKGEATVIEKNLMYARKKEEELCKLVGYGDSINSSESLQKESV